MQKWHTFHHARALVRKLGLRSVKDWREHGKLGDIPDSVPHRPDIAYKTEWKGWGDWLGVAKKRTWRPFHEARAYTRSQGFKSCKDWKSYSDWQGSSS